MRTAFFDIDTQLDFVSPAGALYVPGAERLLPAIARLNAAAPVLISTADAHSEDDAEFRTWPAHCIAGTLGQRKAAVTLLERPAVVACGGDATVDARQYIVEKRRLDAFSNPALTALLDRLQPERCVVYGVVTEYCVRCATAGLLRRGARVELVRDAVMSLSAGAEAEMLREFREAGGVETSVEKVLAGL